MGALARHLPAGLDFLTFRHSAINDAALLELLPTLLGLQRCYRIDLGGCINLSVDSIRVLKDCASQLAPNDAELSKCWLDGKELKTAHVGDGAPMIISCMRCAKEVPIGSLLYVCSCRRFRCCQ